MGAIFVRSVLNFIHILWKNEIMYIIRKTTGLLMFRSVMPCKYPCPACIELSASLVASMRKSILFKSLRFG